MGKGYAQKYRVNYDFSAVCETGQTLWYKIIDEAHRYVAVVAPSSSYYTGHSYVWYDFYGGFERPVGDLVIPEQVQGYTVVGLYESHVWDYWYNKNDKTSGTFQGCTGLTSVVIPNTVQSIQQSAFAGCSSLVSITIPESIPYIESGSTFSGCTSLNSVLYKGSIAQWCGFTFSDKSRNPLYHAHNLYVDNTLITDLVIPDGVTSVGNYAFSGCFMTSITIPNSVNAIGKGSFSDCTGLTSLTIPNSVTTIENGAFSGCIGLTSITIPVSVDTIGGAAFGGCSRLTTVYYNAENAVASNVFCSYQNGNWVNSCPNLTTIHIGADVQEIGSNIFKICDGVHLVVALGPTPATLVGDAFTDFADNSILMVSCGNKLNYFSVWNMFDFNNILEDCGEYSVNLNNIGTGGNVSASTTQAQMGQEVQLTVTPNAGMVLSSLTVCNTSDPTQTIPVMPVGKATSMYRFVMPPFGVSVTATFVAGTSVGENGSVPASVYPNPTNGQIKIEAESLKHITIGNMLGQTIYEGKAYGDRFEYDFGKHGAGIYLVRIETGEGVATKLVVVTR